MSETDKNNNNLSLGEYLRMLRTGAGHSIRGVERQTSISNAYLSQLETGKIDKPSPNFLHELAELYGTSYGVLMEKAGYAMENKSPERKAKTGIAYSTLEGLTKNEEVQVTDFIAYLKSKRQKEN